MRININNVSHDFAGTVILDRVQLAINSGQKVGLIGPNGSGKTTLLRILAGQMEPVTGTVTRDPPGVRVGVVPQSLTAEAGATVVDYLLSDILPLRTQLRSLEEQMGESGITPERLERTLLRYQQCREEYDALDGDTAEEQAQRTLDELGLPVALESALESLSGGEQNVLALAHAVMGRPDLLMLDEPGNHLDFAGLAWLESYLAAYPGAVLIVSHNRYLLDRVVDVIWELDGARVSEFSGTYSDYRFARISQALSDQATYGVQRQHLARLEELVKVFEQRARTTADPAWGKRLRARRTQLEKARERAIDAPRLMDERIELQFGTKSAQADLAVEINGYSRAFGDRVLFTDASLRVATGERVGIVGANGTGKTTLLSDLIAHGSWENPTLRVGPSMRVGYCAQKRGRLDDVPTLTDAILRFGDFSRQEIYRALGPLLFAWEDLDRPVRELSGGEWNRLQLAIAIITRANLLILDEPTNHLDIPSREAVQEALLGFAGTIIAVSHDRYFLDAVANRIVSVDDHALTSFDGGFSEFWREQSRPVAQIRPDTISRRGQSIARSGARKRSGGGSGRSIEERIVALEAEQRQVERQMEQAFAEGDYRRGRALGSDLDRVRGQIEDLYAQWS